MPGGRGVAAGWPRHLPGGAGGGGLRPASTGGARARESGGSAGGGIKVSISAQTVVGDRHDVFFVAGTLAFIAALATFIRAYRRTGLPLGGPAQLAAIAASAAVLVAALTYWVLLPVATAAAPFWTHAVNLTYPVRDAVLLVANLVLLDMALRLRGDSVWKVWAALLAGFVATAAGDILFAFFSVVECRGWTRCST